MYLFFDKNESNRRFQRANLVLFPETTAIESEKIRENDNILQIFV